ncbi:hypothetical protein CIPAW_10G101600 [Carya illinoinensis]|uniref:Ammonium transporter AmtB-like domain-containing protein n=1 Tax=Carya illinoinensis TaxID=32201 RepID=A0A8T1PCY0_CARIL|nr:hypothetical protein CIPAW_10G101600 [Carya illinoinensis]
MVAMELTDAEVEDQEVELRTETKMTTRNMQIENGGMILIISSPRESRMFVGFVFWAIGCSKIELILVLGGDLLYGCLRIPWFTMMIVHKRSKLLQNIDDTLGVIHTHAVAGLLGGILSGIFAEPQLCKLFLPIISSRGGVYGGSSLSLQFCCVLRN